MVRVKNPQVGWVSVGQKHGTRRQWTILYLSNVVTYLKMKISQVRQTRSMDGGKKKKKKENEYKKGATISTPLIYCIHTPNTYIHNRQPFQLDVSYHFQFDKYLLVRFFLFLSYGSLFILFGVDHTSCFGHIVTSRIERSHTKLKSYLSTSISHLERIYHKIVLTYSTLLDGETF